MIDIQISTAIQDLLSKMMAVTPNIIAAFVVFLFGWFFVKLLTKGVKKLLDKIGINKLDDKLKSIDFIEQSNIDINFSKIFSKAIYYFLMLFVLIISTDILGLEVVSNLIGDLFSFLPKLLVAAIVLIFGTIFSDIIKKLASTTLASLGVPSYKIISNFIFYFLFINIFIIALSQSGIETSFLSQNITMIIGGMVLAFSISYGLASRGFVSNYLASFYISDKFEVGDRIIIDDIKGTIVDIDKSSCTLKTENGKIIIPLSNLTQKSVEILG